MTRFDVFAHAAIVLTTSLLVLSCFTGCVVPGNERIYFTDTIDLDFDFDASSNPMEAMHQPYVLGASTTVGVHSRRADDMTRWDVFSADGSILQIDDRWVDDDGSHVSLAVTAVGTGITELEVYDEFGTLVGTAPVEVRMPDRAVLSPHGPLIIDQEHLIRDTDSFQVVRGGWATFLVEWFDGDRQLYGNGALDARSADPELLVDIDRSYLFEDREWLQVRPGDDLDYRVDILCAGLVVDEIGIEGIDGKDIDRVRIYAESETHARQGDWLTLLAGAWDANARPVYGVDFRWSVDGVEGEDLGDLYRYEFDRNDAHMVGAAWDDLEDQVVIHGDGVVDSSNSVGCSHGSGTAGAPAAALAFLVCGLVALRMRRG